MTNMKEGKPSMASAVRYRLLFIALVVVIFIARADKIRPYYGGKATLRLSLDHLPMN